MEQATGQEQSITAREASDNADINVRCVEKLGVVDNEDLKNLVAQAEQSLEDEENYFATRREILKKLQAKLENEIIKDVYQLKAPVDNTGAVKDDMRRKWRVLGMKVRLGVGGVAATKRRDVSDPETFII
jgi:adenine specific DNA methylase Mod